MMGPGSLDDSLRLMEERLPGWLVAAEQFADVRTLARRLPPSHFAGFEYRLNAPEPGIDFQQAITLNPERTRQFSAGQGPPGLKPRVLLHTLFGLWHERPEVKDTFSQAWLEFDRADIPEGDPSLFLTVHPGTGSGQVEKALDALARGFRKTAAAPDLPHTFEGLLTPAPATGPITHVGFMIARGDPSVRVIRAMDPHLTSFRPDDGPDIQHAMQALAGRLGDTLEDFTAVRRCDSVGGGAPGALDLECFFPVDHDDPASLRILDRLRTLGLCSEREHAFFSAWPAWLTPSDPTLRWPESLILESLGRPAGEFSAIECRLGHVKLSMAPGQGHTDGLKAKLYFGYVNRWMKRAGRQDSKPR